MLLDVQNITKSFDSNIVLEGISFHINEGEKCALIGSNGCGKTTLLRTIIGELAPDSGSVVMPSRCTVGYLAQNHQVHTGQSLYEYIKEAKAAVFLMEKQLREMESEMKHCTGSALESLMGAYSRLSAAYDLAEGFACESRIRGVISGLGFTPEDYGRSVDTMSGGEKTRAALGRLLMDEHDLLILDEPTNHLDLKSTEWLEGFLSSSKKAVLVVSHDRYFLDRIVTKVIGIENRKALCYEGNYTEFGKKRENLRREQMKAWLSQQQEIRHQEEVIRKLRSFNREKSIKRAESRVKALAKIERVDKPVELSGDMHLKFIPACRSGNDVLEVEELSRSFDGETLFRDLSFLICRSERVALIGANGTGKSTILRIINGLLSADGGSVTFGANVIPGYYDQEQQLLDPENTVFEEISDAYPEMSNTDIRNVCAGFLFTGDDVFKQIHVLSGGEKARLALAKLMLSGPNFLILDEPTNHLDIVSREILEDALLGYEGTVFYVSHDRYFINRTATRILELEDRRITEYKGNYDYYLEKKTERETAASDPAFSSPAASADDEGSGPAARSSDWEQYKKEQARIRKQAADLKRLEDRIEQIENRIREIDEEISLPENAANAVLLTERYEERSSLQTELDERYEQWEALSEQAQA